MLTDLVLPIYLALILVPVLRLVRPRLTFHGSRALNAVRRLGERAQRVMLVFVVGLAFVITPYLPGAIAYVFLFMSRKRLDLGMLMSDISIRSVDAFRYRMSNHPVLAIRKAFNEASQMPAEERQAYLLTALPQHLNIYARIIEVFLKDPSERTLQQIQLLGSVQMVVGSIQNQIFITRAGVLIAPFLVSLLVFLLKLVGNLTPEAELLIDATTFITVGIGTILAGEF